MVAVFIDPNKNYPNIEKNRGIGNFKEWYFHKEHRGDSFHQCFQEFPVLQAYWRNGLGKLVLIDNWWHYVVTFTGDGVG